jgi:hypothetical protein
VLLLVVGIGCFALGRATAHHGFERDFDGRPGQGQVPGQGLARDDEGTDS